MGKLIPTALLICIWASAPEAWAESRSERFVAMMSRLPDTALTAASQGQPEFVDFLAARDVAGIVAAARPEVVRPDAQRISGGPFADAPQGQDWTVTVGFSAADLVAAATVDAPPERQTALLLTPDALPRIAPALLADGYARTDEAEAPVFWRGEPDYAVDMAGLDPADPFAHPLPKSSRIALDGDVLLHSSSWPGIDALLAAGGTSPVLSAFATALDLPDWGDRKLVQAIIFSDPAFFAPSFIPDPKLVLTPVEPKGIPAWQNLMLADLSDGTRDLTLIALLYARRDEAESAAAILNADFGAMPLLTQVNTTLEQALGPGSASVIGEGPFLTLYTIETEPEAVSPGMLRNRGFRILFNAAYSRTLPLLASVP